MSGEKNLIPLNRRTKEEQKEITTAGGKASGESRRRKRSLKEAADLFLSLPVTDQKTFNAMAKAGVNPEDTDYQIEYQIVKKEETKNPTDSKETPTGTAGKKPTGTSVSGKQVKTAKTGDSISYLWILMIAGSIAVIGGMIYVIRRRKQK